MVLSKNKTLKNKKKYPELAILETAQAGACWPCTRVANVLDKGGSVCELCWQYTQGCFHSFWKCPALRNSEDEAIIESQHLIDELDINRIAFFNRALVQEHELQLEQQYLPLDEYTIHVCWNKKAPLQQATYREEVRLYEPRGTRSMGSPHPDEGRDIPVLYQAPDWVPDCGVDQLLQQAGYNTSNSNTQAASSLDNPDTDMHVEAESDPDTPDTPNHTQNRNTTEAYPEGWPSGYYFGDGSGGKYSKYEPITRCGVGLHYVSLEKTPLIDASMPLPGKMQTNNRAEIYAILLAVKNVEIAGKIDFFTDNKPARNTYNKGRRRAILACHADLWSEIFTIIETKHI